MKLRSQILFRDSKRQKYWLRKTAKTKICGANSICLEKRNNERRVSIERVLSSGERVCLSFMFFALINYVFKKKN